MSSTRLAIIPSSFCQARASADVAHIPSWRSGAIELRASILNRVGPTTVVEWLQDQNGTPLVGLLWSQKREPAELVED